MDYKLESMVRDLGEREDLLTELQVRPGQREAEFGADERSLDVLLATMDLEEEEGQGRFFDQVGLQFD